jgi:hypothetical protein
MAMRKWLITYLIGVLIVSGIRADEGMWLVPLIKDLNIDRMQEMGLELDAEEIYSLDGPSLKDVIGALDYGSCTAEIISSDGLIITNHHCGEDDIQFHSSPEHDYLTNGFWAMSREEELPIPGKTISFVIRMENVTQKILGMVHFEMTEAEREAEIDKSSETLIGQTVEGTPYEAVVVPIYEGNEYYLVVLQTFKDVRLVGAPPESIGRFGGDQDNWEWPRHNADFCLMRIYTAPNGTPAEYAPGNIPYKPIQWLPISLSGYEEDDFSLVLGFPGSTDRYATSSEIGEIKEIENRNRIKIRGEALDLMMEDMKSNDRVRIQYTAKYSMLSNYYKYSLGQNLSIDRLDVIGKRKSQEGHFTQWITGDAAREEAFGDVLSEIDAVVSERTMMENALSYLEEMFLMHKAVEIFDFATVAFPFFFQEMGYASEKEQKSDLMDLMRDKGKDFYRNYNPRTDQKIASAMMQMYAQDVEPLYYPGLFSSIHKDFNGDIIKYIDHLYRKSIFTDPSRFEKFTEKPKFKKLMKDPAFMGSFSMYQTYQQILDEYEELDDRYNTARRKYVIATREMYPDSIFYPDANSTLRLSYGTVCDYLARDAVRGEYYTTLAGVMEKEDPENRAFQVPEKLKQLYEEKNYQPYVRDNTMRVCFLTNLDTTGGNSGSPVLNSRGELIGLNFDGNWESMSGDIIYEPEFQRSICVDIRYVLFIIDKFAGAQHLIQEMDINDQR